MAARVLANLLVAGAGVLIRAGVQAYRQAIVNAGKTGAAGTAASSARAATQMSLEEAHKILGAPPGTPAAELVRRYNHLFRANDECGSFYLTSKVYRARERIEAEVGPLEDDGVGGGSGESAAPAEPGRVTDGRAAGSSSAQ